MIAAGVSDVHPSWVAALWPGLDERHVQALLATARVQPRLTPLLAARFGWAQVAHDGSAEAALAAGPLGVLDAAAGLAGAVWHARAIRQVIAAREVETLTAALGPARRGFALANIELAVAAPERLELSALVARIDAAAETCRAAWLAALRPGMQQLVLPRLPRAIVERALAQPVGPETQPALRIMARVALHLSPTRGAAVDV